MKKIKCIVVDDEPLARKLIEEYIQNFPFLELEASCKNAFEAMAILQEKSIDLIFLDIQMPVMLGTQFIKSLSQKPSVIFITAYSNYAIESYDLDVVDYLMKPVSLERFGKAINKVFTKIQPAAAQIEPVSSAIQETKDFLFVNVEYALVKIVFEDITHVEGLKDYIKIYLSSQQKPILTKSTIKGFEEKLPLEGFVRVHKSFIVSVRKIESIKAQRIKIGNHDIPISEGNYEGLLKLLVS